MGVTLSSTPQEGSVEWRGPCKIERDLSTVNTFCAFSSSRALGKLKRLPCRLFPVAAIASAQLVLVPGNVEGLRAFAVNITRTDCVKPQG